MKKLDLNVDIGEGFPHDAALLALATSANVCCGKHAGSWNLTRHTVALCAKHGVRIGAHPGYPDRASMGRAAVSDADWVDAIASIREQIEHLVGICHCAYIKPHGTFYNESTVPGRASSALSAIVESFKVPLMGLPGTEHEIAARAAGVSFIREGFADRAYLSDGRLVPRNRPDAVFEVPSLVRAQALLLAPRVDSLCLHGDTDGCVEFAELVRSALEQAGFEVGW